MELFGKVLQKLGVSLSRFRICNLIVPRNIKSYIINQEMLTSKLLFLCRIPCDCVRMGQGGARSGCSPGG